MEWAVGGGKLGRRVTWGLDLLTLGAIGFVAFTLWKPPHRGPEPPPSPVGRPAPVFNLVGESEAVGRVAHSLVFVFRSDCPVCAQQKRNWLAMAAAGRDLGFRALAVTPEPITREIADYFETPDIDVRQLASLDALQQLGITQVPTTLVVDAGGVVRYRHAGVVALGDSVLKTLR